MVRYFLRLRPSGAKKVTEEFNKWVNKKVTYQGKLVIWSYALLLKTRELAHYRVEKRKTIDFSKPYYAVERQDSEDIRQKILSISYTDWKKMGFFKSTLHHMKQNT